jgi:hypothetical protein
MTQAEADELNRLLEVMRDQYTERGLEKMADQIADVMDLVDGWCSPRVRLHVVPVGLEREGWDIPPEAA